MKEELCRSSDSSTGLFEGCLALKIAGLTALYNNAPNDQENALVESIQGTPSLFKLCGNYVMHLALLVE